MNALASPVPPVQPRERPSWPSEADMMGRYIPRHDSLPDWADRRLHLAAWLLDKADGPLPADAPEWVRRAMRDLHHFLGRRALAQAAERTEAEIEAREELAWMESRERAEYVAERAGEVAW